LLIETAFTIVQWVLVAPLTVATSRQSRREERRIGAVG
jgi:hypothetical protein